MPGCLVSEALTKTAVATGDSARAWGAPADRRARLRRCRADESPAQLVDQKVQSPLILLGDAHQATEVRHGVGVALRIRGGDLALILVDALIDEAATPGEQSHEVVGLQLVRRIRDGLGERTGGRCGPGWFLTPTSGFRADRGVLTPPAPVSGAGRSLCNARARAAFG